MERLTQERGDRTWKLYHIGWYVNLVAFLAVLAMAFWFCYSLSSGWSEEGIEQVSDVVIMMGLVVVATVLLMGAGISRYQARLEGQHLELKLKLNEILDAVKAGKASE